MISAPDPAAEGVAAAARPAILQLTAADDHGGGGVVAWGLRQRLLARGHRVPMVVGFKRSDDPGVRSLYDTPINRALSRLLGRRNLRAGLHRRLSPWLADDISLLPGAALLRWPEFEAADLVHAHILHSLFFNLGLLPELARRKPVVWTLHDEWPITGYAICSACDHWRTGGCDCEPIGVLRPHRWNNTERLWRRKRRIYRRTPLTLVAPSRWLAERVGRSMLADKPLVVIPNGVDTRRFRPRDRPPLRRKLGLPEDARIVFYAGRTGAKNERKGWRFVRALAGGLAAAPGDRRPTLFLCTGGGEPGPGIVPVPFITDRELLAEHYAASDLFLTPTLADNCPLSVLEALASGLPVLSFRTGGVPELVEHGETGYLAAYADGADLLTGLLWLLSLPPERCAAMGAAARRQAEARYTLERMTDDYVSLFHRVLAERARSAGT